MAFRLPNIAEYYDRNPWPIDFILLFFFFAFGMQWMRSKAKKETGKAKLDQYDMVGGLIGATLGVIALGRARTTLAAGIAPVMSFGVLMLGLMLFRYYRTGDNEEQQTVFSIAISFTAICIGLFLFLGSNLSRMLPPNIAFILNAGLLFMLIWSIAAVAFHTMKTGSSASASGEKKEEEARAKAEKEKLAEEKEKKEDEKRKAEARHDTLNADIESLTEAMNNARTPEEIRAVLDRIDALRKAGKLDEFPDLKELAEQLEGFAEEKASLLDKPETPEAPDINIKEPDININVDTNVENDEVELALASAERDAARAAAGVRRRLAA